MVFCTMLCPAQGILAGASISGTVVSRRASSDLEFVQVCMSSSPVVCHAEASLTTPAAPAPAPAISCTAPSPGQCKRSSMSLQRTCFPPLCRRCSLFFVLTMASPRWCTMLVVHSIAWLGAADRVLRQRSGALSAEERKATHWGQVRMLHPVMVTHTHPSFVP